MRFYRDRETGEIMREDKARKACRGAEYYAFYHQFEILQGDELTRAVINDIIATHEPADKYKYMLLDRLQADCGYYLHGGNRNAKYLWGGSVAAHLDAMRALYNSFPERYKPEWLTPKQIDDYAAQMEREPTGQGEALPLWDHSKKGAQYGNS